MTIPYPNRLQWAVIWCTVVVATHFWLGLSLADWLPAVQHAVPGIPAEPARLVDCWTIGPMPAVPAVERKVLWRESAWGLSGYFQPAVGEYRERLALVVVIIGLLLVWQASRVSNRRSRGPDQEEARGKVLS